MALVIGLTSSIVAIVYICLLPLILQTYTPAWICWHLAYGHWNLIMIVFHYYKAITTSPGHPPQVRHGLAAQPLPAGHWGLATDGHREQLNQPGGGLAGCLPQIGAVKLGSAGWEGSSIGSIAWVHKTLLTCAQAKNDLTGVSICRKCIAPKPARTHHCSICNR